MKRSYMMALLALAVMMAFLWVAFAPEASATEEKCSEGNFAVAELPFDIDSYPDPCSRIMMPPDVVIAMKVTTAIPIFVKFGENTMIVQERMVRVGGNPTELYLRPTKKPEFSFQKVTYVMKVVAVPKHLKGGENALWYEIASAASPAGGNRIEFLSEFPTQVLVPRGCKVRIMGDAGFRVKYAGEERECAAEELVTLEGKPGSDLVEIYGLDRDGTAIIGVSLRKPLSLEKEQPVAKPQKKKAG